MIKKLPIILSLTILSGLAFAQKKNSAVIVVGRKLNANDSVRVRELFYSGLEVKTSQKFDEAAGYFQAVLEIDPGNAPALFELANQYLVKGELSTAETYARRAVTVDSSNKWYWLLLADIYKNSSNFSQLILVFDELIRLEPEEEDYYYDKANAYLLLKKAADAEKVYALIESKFGSSEELAHLRQQASGNGGMGKKGTEELEKLIAANPSNIRNYLVLSEAYQKSGDLNKAEGVLLKAKSVEEKNAFVRLALADVYNAKGKVEEGFSELKVAMADPALGIDPKIRITLSLFPKFQDPSYRKKAAELTAVICEAHPSDPKAFSVQGDVLFQDNQFEEAKKSYRKALALTNEVYQIWEQLLRLDVSTGDFAAAIADGEEALTLFPNQPSLYFFTALSYAQTNKHEKAVSYFKNAIGLGIEDAQLQVQVLSSMGDSYNTLKRYKESDEAFEEALKLDPSNTYVLNNYAYYLALRGESLQKAADMSLRANQLKPDNASFEDTHAWVLFRQQKFAEARSWMEKALKHNSNSAVQWEHYGDILFNLGEKERALQQWLKAKEKGAKSETLEKKINEKKFIE